MSDYVYQHAWDGCECREASKCQCDCHTKGKLPLTNKPKENEVNGKSVAKLSTEEVLENIFTLINLPARFDPKNGIPKASYDAVKSEFMDFAKQYAEEEIVKLFEGENCKVALLEHAAFNKGLAGSGGEMKKQDPFSKVVCATKKCKRPVHHYDGDYWCNVDFKRVQKLKARWKERT